jgi:hypothetical protein
LTISLLLESTLDLLSAKLNSLAESPYFTPSLEKYLSQTKQVAQALISQSGDLPEQTSWTITESVWSATHYLEGSKSNSTPYEIAYVLEKALRDWIDKPAAITTAIIHDCNFYFKGVDHNYQRLVQSELGIALDQEVVQIELPELYRNRPLPCIALFHELGHFVDRHHGVTNLATLLAMRDRGEQVDPSNPPPPEEIVNREEHFSDLFAASYVGEAIAHFLEQFAPGDGDSKSHPSTAKRVALIRSFLSGEKSPEIELLQHTLAKLKVPQLEKRFKEPDLVANFSNVRPYDVQDVAELYGVLGMGWRFWLNKPSGKYELWRYLSKSEVARIVNDLVQKSIRNWMIKEKWNCVAAG